MTNLFMVFDVESVGLHGEGFAVGYVVVDREGSTHEVGSFACPVFAAKGSASGFDWVKRNCPEIPKTHDSPWLVRAAFWRAWRMWASKGAALVADCAWPVEARFLVACVDDHPVANEWLGPYPLYDLAPIRLAAGLDPLATVDRLPEEKPIHDPLCDARQSARLLIEALSLTSTPAGAESGPDR